MACKCSEKNRSENRANHPKDIRDCSCCGNLEVIKDMSDMSLCVHCMKLLRELRFNKRVQKRSKIEY